MAFITLSPKLRLVYADCRDVLRELPDDFIDSCVTDPPYGIDFMGKEWDRPGSLFGRGIARGYGEFCEDWARELFRVLKPGGYIAAFSGTRTYHRMACAIEDAGFEIRDSLMWIYGSGFPKSHDVSKGIDRAAGAQREVIGPKPNLHSRGNHKMADGWHRPWMDDPNAVDAGMMETAPATDAAREWQGWGTSLKPAFEPIVLARKPLSEGTVAANVLKWGTGAINVDGCRIATDEVLQLGKTGLASQKFFTKGVAPEIVKQQHSLGRWPANVCHDGSDEVVGMFPRSNGQQGAVTGDEPSSKTNAVYGQFHGGPATQPRGDSGSAARFFYSAKASKADRAGSKHPTVKPIALMQWLARLITPPGGIILDPFAGSGTTGAAAAREGFAALLCEREEEYVRDIMHRFGVGASA